MRRGSTGPVVVEVAAPELEVRALRTHAEYTACVRLQRETWGSRYADCVPASLLKVSQLVGGVCGGAFDEDGSLIGFVYGLTGMREGRLMHWSHMLAVAGTHRDRGVGRRLKEYQRAEVRSSGIEMIYWTFDPLVARNAHLNLNRLGSVIQEYVPDMYGSTGSRLHAFGTDRFVVAWPVAAGRVAPRPDVPRAWRAAPVATPHGDGARPSVRLVSAASTAGVVAVDGQPVVRVEIPADIESLALPQARRWRKRTQGAFELLLGSGYAVTGFFSDERARCFYVLEPAPAAPAGVC
jgi:chorismate synthase